MADNDLGLSKRRHSVLSARMLLREARWVFAVLFLFVSFQQADAQSLASQGFFEAIALPGERPFGETAKFGGAVINDLDEVTFTRTEDEPPATPGLVWSTTGVGGLHPVMTQGMQAPGYPAGVGFNSQGLLVLNDNASQVIIEAHVTGPGITSANDSGIWIESAAGDLDLLAAEGSPVPGIAGVDFAGFAAPSSVGTSGHVAVRAELTGVGVDDTNDAGIWVQDDLGDLQKVARGGESAPGTSELFDALFSSLAVNSSGKVAFASRVGSHPGTSDGRAGVWSDAGGSGLELVARQQDLLPTQQPAVVGQNILGVFLNDSGQVGFATLLSGAQVDLTNDIGVFIETPEDNLRLLARKGDDAPHLAGNEILKGIGVSLLNNAGYGAFTAVLAGDGVDTSNDEVIFSETGGLGTRLVAREGQAAPGADPGLTLKKLTVNSGFEINNDDVVLFTALLDGPGITSENDQGIWAEIAPGEVELVIREGDELEVMPGEFRTVKSLESSRHRLNDSGMVVVAAKFTDFSGGLFVISLPEPSLLLGDISEDGAVDIGDFTLWGNAFGDTGVGLPADLSFDGQVDIGDFTVWGDHFGETAAPAANGPSLGAVPEPSAFTLLCVGGLIVAAYGFQRCRRISLP